MPTAVTRWEQRAEWPLTAIALVFLAAYATPIIAPDLSPSVRELCENLMTVAWAAFAIDYVIRLGLAKGARWTFLKTNLLDLAVVLLPLLRPLRLIRLFALLSILNRTGTYRLRGRVVTYAIGGTLMLVLLGALAVTEAERGTPDAHIQTFGDGLWWALTTITTVGYGDIYPITVTGRIVAATLMISGVALLGIVTATIASWLVERVTEVAEVEQSATRIQVEELAAEVRELREALRNASTKTPDLVVAPEP